MRGYTTVSEFVDAHPLRGLVQLADDLGGGDVAAVQIETVLVDEARSTGTIELRARGELIAAANLTDVDQGEYLRPAGSAAMPSSLEVFDAGGRPPPAVCRRPTAARN